MRLDFPSGSLGTSTNGLLVLYDDAQSIYERARSKQFSFKSVGIQAQGRATILKPLSIKPPTLQAEAEAIADHLAQAHIEGFAWSDMAVLCADTKTRNLCARTLAQRKLPVENRLGSGDFDSTSNKIKVMSLKVSKGLEFPVVALLGAGHIPANGEDENEPARVFCVDATRARHRLAIAMSGQSGFGGRLVFN